MQYDQYIVESSNNSFVGFIICICAVHVVDEWIKDVQTARHHYNFTIIKDVLIGDHNEAVFCKKRRQAKPIPHKDEK